MKTLRVSPRSVSRPGSGWLLASLLSACALIAPVRADDPVASPKDHALFMGGDLSVEYAGARHLVVGADAGSVYLRVAGKRIGVPMAKLAGLRIERNLKLSDTVAQIGDFSAKPTAARRSGRNQQWLEQMSDLQSTADQAQADSMKYYKEAEKALARSGSESGEFTDAKLKYDNASNFENRTNELLSATKTGDFASAENDKKGALAVAGRLSATKPAQDAFVLVVVEYHEGADGPRQQQVQLELLPALGVPPRNFECVVGGLPEGFVLERCELHLFADGLEIASNLSEKRMDLTADDAMRFMVVSFLADHPNETVAASPLRIVVPAGFKQKLKAGQLDKPVFLTIAPNGMVTHAASGPGATALDAELDGVVRRFWFTPALAAGSPIESVVELKLADLLR